MISRDLQLMGHKVLLPVDGDVVNIKILPFPEDYKAAFLSISAGKAPDRCGEKNCFSIYRANAVVMTAPEAQFKRL
ncbi:hypothetical protein KCP69_22945 [Salmonella enterica subsp. enterica]|nr:hypothetical protein KCP69_22945 [Salmonella enterica subsp. enterica]